MLYALAHWAFGPSKLLEQISDRAKTEFLPDLISGIKSMGFTNELGLTEAWQALRVVNVADGTNEILKKTIAQRLQKGDLSL